MALVWLTRDDYTKALDFARRYLETSNAGPDPARVKQAHQTLGLVELASGNFERATEELSQGDLTEAFTQYHLARAYEARGLLSQALQYYRAASVYDQFNPLTQAFVRKRAKEGAEALLLAQQGHNGTTAMSTPLPSPGDRKP
jgi:tetratricopeptide (TPR) repeat protein